MLELYQLNVFVQAAEALSFTAAAERPHISQPAVSMQISNLEKRLDTLLFDRSSRNICTTEAAQGRPTRWMRVRAGVSEVRLALQGKAY